MSHMRSVAVHWLGLLLALACLAAGCGGRAAQPRPAETVHTEDEAFAAATRANSVESYRAFLHKYGSGKHGTTAQKSLRTLRFADTNLIRSKPPWLLLPSQVTSTSGGSRLRINGEVTFPPYRFASDYPLLDISFASVEIPGQQSPGNLPVYHGGRGVVQDAEGRRYLIGYE